MYLILLVWLTLAIPASPLCTYVAWGHELTEDGFLEQLQDKQGEHQWKAATYRGITIGKSTTIELRQKWGKPKWSGHWEWDNPKNPKFLLYDYDVQEGLTGTLRVEAETKTGKVTSIEISPDELSLNQATELFGKDYIETRYKSCKCVPEDEAPIFESPDGNYLYFEYRGRGIAMVVSSGQVTSIQLVDKPIGFESSKDCEKIPSCNPRGKSIKRKRS